MANNKNLKSNSERTPRERKELAKKAGIKSGEARRARKTLKDHLLMLLEEDTNQDEICIAILNQAKKGNIKAFGIIRDTIGENPIIKKEVTGKDGAPLTQKVFVTPEEYNEVQKHIEDFISND